jgi:hypothetical protein
MLVDRRGPSGKSISSSELFQDAAVKAGIEGWTLRKLIMKSTTNGVGDG